MDVQQSFCNRRAIEELLADRLSDAEQAALEAHLVECPSCRQRLDDLAADERMWNEARGYLTSVAVPGSDSNFDDEPNVGALAGLRTYLTPTDDPRLLGRLGGYGVVGLIGCGGFGVVLKAFDAALNRYVAIKALSPPLAMSGAARQRFAREARAAAAVVHDNVVAIHAVAETEGLPYFVMPHVRGPSLEKRLNQNGPLDVPAILRIGMQVAGGLAAAHSQGLVHRDIKPANILLEDGAERVTITDFGLARAVDDASLTRSGVIAGTPPYMSPEQAAGLAVDHRSDLFSLGSVLYAMCTGRPPFRAETTLAVLRRVEESSPRPIREINPDIPAWLESIVGKLHAKNPADRFGSAAEVAELLEGCLAHVQQPLNHALPPVAVVLNRPRGRRDFSRWAIAVPAVAAVALTLFLVSPRNPGFQTTDEQSQSNELSDRTDENKSADANILAGLARLETTMVADVPADHSFAAAIASLRQQADALWQTLESNNGMIADRFTVEIEHARQRVDALNRQLKTGTEQIDSFSQPGER